MTMLDHIRTIHVRPDYRGVRGGCHVCGEGLERFEPFGAYDHGDGYGHDVCADCLEAGPERIRDQLTADAERLTRRAAALRTDPLFTDEADRLDAQADEYRADAAGAWKLPTAADWVAFHRETEGACLPLTDQEISSDVSTTRVWMERKLRELYPGAFQHS